MHESEPRGALVSIWRGLSRTINETIDERSDVPLIVSRGVMRTDVAQQPHTTRTLTEDKRIQKEGGTLMGIRTGAEYRERLKDGRTVYVNKARSDTPSRRPATTS